MIGDGFPSVVLSFKKSNSEQEALLGKETMANLHIHEHGLGSILLILIALDILELFLHQETYFNKIKF